MRFHLVDRIDGYTPGVEIKARKLTSPDEDFWQMEGERRVMPPHLVLEALCQAGAWFVYLDSKGERSAALLSIGSVDFSGDVQPGDVLDIHGTVVSSDAERAVLDGTVSVGGRVVLTARDVMCTLMPGSRLDDPNRLEERALMVLRAERLPR
jgi:3-hydroxyacyl-[acyl-carrier-protein] dehydratase